MDSRKERQPEVVPASYQTFYDVLDDELAVSPVPQQPQPPQVANSGNYHTSDAAWESGYQPAACDSCGCGGHGCDVCYSYGGMVAPTAMACSSNCGPIVALLKRLQIRAEVPLYWRRDQGAPPLITTSPAGTDADLAGELGRATTDIIYGNGVLFDEATAGIRLTFSTWLTPDHCNALMFRYWNAGQLSESAQFNSSSFPILARPFFDTEPENAADQTQDAQLIAFPDELVGSMRVDNDSRVDGLELTFRRQLYQDRFNRLDWMTGYQHVRIEERLTIFSNSSVIGDAPGLQGASIAVTDMFETDNEFHGFFYGLMNTRRVACLKIESMFRLGMGNLRRTVDIAGRTTTTSDGVSATQNQGLLARNTNSIPFMDDTFIVIPEVGLNLAYQIRPGLDFNVGYNYMLIPKVGQAAQQIDFNGGNRLPVNLSDPLVGDLDPSLSFEERKYWLHSLGLGLQWNY
ncbi:MAG: BBP7 family outer membrane beta-barrel protein [bacterium]|nr:BBP7 family outer membrane beta-barrel protein [bacterium]